MSYEATDINRVRRVPKRGAYDKETIYTIVDEALICHVGFAVEGQPFVIPTIHARHGDDIIFHGSTASRMMKLIAAGHALSVNMTLVDGLVMARSVFHHSMNYRSVVLFGQGIMIEDRDEKLAAMEVLTDRIMLGRWDDARQPTDNEIKATLMARMPIDSASAKIRVGPPGDDEEDYALPVWAGVIPVIRHFGEPEVDPRLSEGINMPAYVADYIERRNSIT